jgi:hypothetical protein
MNFDRKHRGHLSMSVTFLRNNAQAQQKSATVASKPFFKQFFMVSQISCHFYCIDGIVCAVHVKLYVKF